jgi:hypothetical protein
VDFPYWYSVAQLLQESRCRNVISLDGVGSQGLAQITFRWWKKDLAKIGVYNLRTTSNQLKAQAYINYKGYKKAKCKKLFVMYQIYNGGTLVNKELKGTCKWSVGYNNCHRKIIHFKNGYTLNACKINYDYSKKIYLYGNKYYRDGTDSEKWSFW